MGCGFREPVCRAPESGFQKEPPGNVWELQTTSAQGNGDLIFADIFIQIYFNIFSFAAAVVAADDVVVAVLTRFFCVAAAAAALIVADIAAKIATFIVATVVCLICSQSRLRWSWRVLQSLPIVATRVRRWPASLAMPT